MVFLVGTTPGDPGLMTVRGLAGVRRAEVLVYDEGVSPSLLNEAQPDTVLHKVTPEAADRRTVATVMAEAALAGKTVCRLYAGGPLLSGAAEEAPVLAERAVPAEILPAVLPELAAAVYAGVGLGRPTNLAILDATPSGAAGGVAAGAGAGVGAAGGPNIAWDHLAVGVATLVVRLDAATLPDIAGRLLSGGRPATTPVAVISRGTQVDQRTVAGTLGTIADEVRQAGVSGQVVAVIGQAATRRPELNWYETKPLFGQTVLVTRAKSQASLLVDLIADLGGRTYEFPAITTLPPASYESLDAAIANIERYRWLVITSQSGAEHFHARLMASGKDVRALAHLRIAAVGSATAKALAAAGMKADLVPKEFRGAALPAAMAPYIKPGDRVLMARADLADPLAARELQALGAEVDDLVAYRTVKEGGDAQALKAALAGGKISYVTFTSSSTVVNLLERLGGPEALAQVRVACMGPETKKAAEAAGLTVHVLAQQVTVESLVNAIVEDAHRT